MTVFSGIRQNIRAHDAIAESYDAVHGEIFNDTEQARLSSKLGEAARPLRSGGKRLKALDLGCGSGNLTRHLLKLGFEVTAADVSEKFLKMVARMIPAGGGIETVKINGADLSCFSDGIFDLTAAYSVLHHVPDYLGMVREMARVTAPGGVLYIDHECSPGFWERSAVYDEYMRESGLERAASPDFSRFFKISTYVNRIKLLFDPRYKSEGDIHVWPDDHIEWSKVEEVLRAGGFETMTGEDYLLFRKGCPGEVHERYRGVCGDMRVLVARKAAF